MMAEGPRDVQCSQRLQAEQVADDLWIMPLCVVANAIAVGRLPAEVQTAVQITGVPPTLAVRDQLQETQRFKIENDAGILSPQTWSQRLGLDYGQEQAKSGGSYGLSPSLIRGSAVAGDRQPQEIDAAALPLDASPANFLGVAQFGS